MGYFITGATGFIGRHVVAGLVARGLPVWVLVRPCASARFDRLVRDCAPRGDLLRPVYGDLQQPLLGVSAQQRQAMQGKVDHFLHLGALYDLKAATDDLVAANVRGTANAIDLAEETRAGCFHFVSSIAAAGRYRGTFTESMFDEASGLDIPYFRTKHEAEGLVRGRCRVPWRIYRPGMVVGHSRTGVIDKIDGPYYFFAAIRKLREIFPPWMPLPGVPGGHINLVPVDFVADALVHLAHVPGQDGRCFHLTDPQDRCVGDVFNLFARAAHAPTMMIRLDADPWRAASARLSVPPQSWHSLGKQAGRLAAQVCSESGIPDALPDLLQHPTTFDSARAQELLTPAGILVPRLEDYAWRLWDYWDRQAAPPLVGRKALRQAVDGRIVLITGGSSGIGKASALELARAGAHVVLVARNLDKLQCVRGEIEAGGGRATIYACDIADPAACDRLIAQILADHDHVDILVNNAGRSIRRPVEETYQRLHDYERLMRVNYFAAVRVTLGLLPAMVRRGSGQVVNISSIGVLTNAPRFAAYNASKAALEAFSRCAAAEYAGRGVHFTVINMPLVRTPMVAPTKIYGSFKLMEPEEAAARVCEAIVAHPPRLTPPLGKLAQFVELLAPALSRAIMSQAFQWFTDVERSGLEGGAGAAARCEPGTGGPAAGAPAVDKSILAALAALEHGIRW